MPVPPQSTARPASCRSLPFVFRLLSSCGLWGPSSAVLNISWTQLLFGLVPFFFVYVTLAIAIPLLLLLGVPCPHYGVPVRTVCVCCAWVCVRVVCAWCVVRVLSTERVRMWRMRFFGKVLAHRRSTENPKIFATCCIGFLILSTIWFTSPQARTSSTSFSGAGLGKVPTWQTERSASHPKAGLPTSASVTNLGMVNW